MPSAIQGKHAGFGRNILRPYFISHQAFIIVSFTGNCNELWHKLNKKTIKFF